MNRIFSIELLIFFTGFLLAVGKKAEDDFFQADGDQGYKEHYDDDFSYSALDFERWLSKGHGDIGRVADIEHSLRDES